MNLLSNPKMGANGCYQDINSKNSQLKYVGFRAYELTPGQELNLHDDEHEMCLIVLSGIVDAKIGDKTFNKVGDRSSVFVDMPPHALYVTNSTVCKVIALTAVELAVAIAPGKSTYPSRWIQPQDMGYEKRGTGSNTRYICDILPENVDADSLLVVEVKTPAGNWSSYPPHKHDEDNIPHESCLEETYYHRVNPSQGFVFQRVFTDNLDIDETMSATDKSVVMVPRGYHPVGVPYGYDSYYLNVMAGPQRKWLFANHPDHEWILKK